MHGVDAQFAPLFSEGLMHGKQPRRSENLILHRRYCALFLISTPRHHIGVGVGVGAE
jgi:hypothetical protein